MTWTRQPIRRHALSAEDALRRPKFTPRFEWNAATLERCDPYLVWADLLADGAQPPVAGAPPGPRIVSLLLELADGQKAWPLQIESLKLSHSQSAATIGRGGRFFACTLRWEDVPRLVMATTGRQPVVRRFVLSMPRFSDDAATSARLKDLRELLRNLDDRSRDLRTRLDEQAKELQAIDKSRLLQDTWRLLDKDLLERFRTFGLEWNLPQYVDSSDTPHYEPLLCVIDDRCNFASRRMLGEDGKPLVGTLWDQNDEAGLIGRRISRYWERAGQFEAVPAPPVGGSAPRPPAMPLLKTPAGRLVRGGVGGCQLQLRREPYGSGQSIGRPLPDRPLLPLPAVDEADVYREAEYNFPPARWSHGSAVLDLIAGGHLWLKSQRHYWRSKPVDLRFVQLPDQTVQDTTGGSLDAHVIDGIQHAIESAQIDREVIVNLSFGTHGGSHDGTSVFEQAVLELLKFYDGNTGLLANGRRLHVVLPAGNTHLWRCHASGHLVESSRCAELHWKIQPDDGTDNFLEIWLPRGAGVTVTLTPPGETSLDAVAEGEACYWSETRDGAEEVKAAVVFPPQAANSTTRTMVLVAVGPTQQRAYGLESSESNQLPRRRVNAPHGVWKVRLEKAEKVPDVAFDAWIQRGDAAPGRPRATRGYRGRQSFFLEPTPGVVSPRATLNGIATAQDPNHANPRLWVVGAMRHDDVTISEYSAAGPTPAAATRFEGPDVVVYGDESRNLPGLLVGGVLSGTRVRVSGTSLSAALFSRLLYRHLRDTDRDNPTPMVIPCPMGPPYDLSSSAPTLVPAGAPEQAAVFHRGEWRRLLPDPDKDLSVDYPAPPPPR